MIELTFDATEAGATGIPPELRVRFAKGNALDGELYVGYYRAAPSGAPEGRIRRASQRARDAPGVLRSPSAWRGCILRSLE
jgi:hypothetical protein